MRMPRRSGRLLALLCATAMAAASCGEDPRPRPEPRLLYEDLPSGGGLSRLVPGSVVLFEYGPFEAADGAIQLRALNVMSPEGLHLFDEGYIRATSPGVSPCPGRSILRRPMDPAGFEGHSFVSLRTQPTLEPGDKVCLAIAVQLDKRISQGRHRLGRVELIYASQGTLYTLRFDAEEFVEARRS